MTNILPVSEIFISLQGEGIRTGMPSIFIRIAGCNYSEEGHPCSWCDTSYAWKVSEQDTPLSDDVIIESIKRLHMNTGINDIVLTGGEPLHHNTVDLIKHFARNYYLTIETNGSLPIFKAAGSGFDHCMWSVSFKGPSSGNQDYNNFENIKLMDYNDQLKFVIACEEDYVWAKKIIDSNLCLTNIVFQPAYKLMKPALLAKRLMNDKELSGKVRMMDQMHKLWWKPNKRGV